MLEAVINSPIASIADAMKAFPGLKWRVHENVIGEGGVAFAKLNGSSTLGDFLILAAIENASAEAHEHLGEPDEEGELIWTLEGELYDTTDDGETIILKPGDKLRHRGGSSHRPYARTFWIGIFRQNKGNKVHFNP